MTANENQNEFSLLKTVPAVLRARGFRLYTEGSKRLVDLWLNGGAAVLGHTPPNFLRELKNTASRGLYAPLPHFTEARYIKALSKLLPGHVFRLYAAPPQELVSLFTNGNAALWRPFADVERRVHAKTQRREGRGEGEGEEADIERRVHAETQRREGREGGEGDEAEKSSSLLVPVLPGIQSWRSGLPLGLCVIAAESESQLEQLPASDILPPLLLAVATRGVYDLIASPQRAKPYLPRIAKAMQTENFKKLWRRQGIYLNLKEKTAPETWASLFAHFLEAGFLLPPISSHPLILPGELSDGEEAKLANALGSAVSLF